jgi:hypothetical protein
MWIKMVKDEKNSLRKTIASYIIALLAGVVAFFLAMNIRIILLATVFDDMTRRGQIPWAMSLINAVTIIVLMMLWLVYVYYTQHYYEKKCVATRAGYINASMKFIVPPAFLLIISEIFIRING